MGMKMEGEEGLFRLAGWSIIMFFILSVQSEDFPSDICFYCFCLCSCSSPIQITCVVIKRPQRTINGVLISVNKVEIHMMRSHP